MKRLLPLLLLITLASTASAQAIQRKPVFTLGAGYGWADDEALGGGFGDITAGGVVSPGPFVFNGDLHINLAPGDGGGRYYHDSSVDRCRDSETGQFAKSSLCSDTVMRILGTLDANISIPSTDFFAGAGFRGGAHSGPYVSAGYVFLPETPYAGLFRGYFWKDYVTISAVVAFGQWR